MSSVSLFALAAFPAVFGLGVDEESENPLKALEQKLHGTWDG